MENSVSLCTFPPFIFVRENKGGTRGSSCIGWSFFKIHPTAKNERQILKKPYWFLTVYFHLIRWNNMQSCIMVIGIGNQHFLLLNQTIRRYHCIFCCTYTVAVNVCILYWTLILSAYWCFHSRLYTKQQRRDMIG